jgi:hypothetical protein
MFNDPFDHQAGFTLDIDDDRFACLLTASIERVVFMDAPLRPVLPLLFQYLLRLRAIRDRVPRGDMLSQLGDASKEVAANLRAGIDGFNTKIHKHLLHSRVFCVSEKNDNVVMWSHYAEQHRGVVFRLACIDALDNRLIAAREVTYTDSFVAFPSLEEYTMYVTGERPLDFVAVVRKIAFTKHVDWQYESEWRVHLSLPPSEPEGDGYVDSEEPPEVFDGIYLGCRMDGKQQEDLLTEVKQQLPHTKVYRAVRSRTRFALAFEPVYGA